MEKYAAIFEKSVEISQKSLVRTFTTHISSPRSRSFTIDLAREKRRKIMEGKLCNRARCSTNNGCSEVEGSDVLIVM